MNAGRCEPRYTDLLKITQTLTSNYGYKGAAVDYFDAVLLLIHNELLDEQLCVVRGNAKIVIWIKQRTWSHATKSNEAYYQIPYMSNYIKNAQKKTKQRFYFWDKRQDGVLCFQGTVLTSDHWLWLLRTDFTMTWKRGVNLINTSIKTSAGFTVTEIGSHISDTSETTTCSLNNSLHSEDLSQPN